MTPLPEALRKVAEDLAQEMGKCGCLGAYCTCEVTFIEGFTACYERMQSEIAMLNRQLEILAARKAPEPKKGDWSHL